MSEVALVAKLAKFLNCSRNLILLSWRKRKDLSKHDDPISEPIVSFRKFSRKFVVHTAEDLHRKLASGS
jgi:hypothetical protein